MTWASILDVWPLLEADLQDAGVDVGDRALMDGRSWRWFRVRVEGLFSMPIGRDFAGNPVFASRLQQHFFASEVPHVQEG